MSKKLIVVLALLLPCFTQAQEQPLATIATQYAFTIEAGISDPVVMGETVDGFRQSIPITGGTVLGDGIKAEILAGGADYQLRRSDGTTQLRAVYMIRTDDGALINVVNEGVIAPGEAGTDERYFRTVPTFTAPNGKYGWLNKQIFVCAVRFLDSKPNTVIIDVYKVL